MLNTIFFDLDGTLLRFTQKAFIDTYFGELTKVFVRLGLNPELAIKAVWAGTKSMVQNDGAFFNAKRFWDTFAEFTGLNFDKLTEVEAACDSFYTNEFDTVKSILNHSDIPTRIIQNLKRKGYHLVLATNPLFPLCAILTRLTWVDIDPSCFSLITHYSNSKYCKPNLDYYKEILTKIGKDSQECMMIGNNPAEDMIAADLGMKVFLVTDYMEDDTNIDITKYRRGSLVELEATLSLLPDTRQ